MIFPEGAEGKGEDHFRKNEAHSKREGQLYELAIIFFKSELVNFLKWHESYLINIKNISSVCQAQSWN